jgi:uncharacterized protein (DUF2252 family)
MQTVEERKQQGKAYRKITPRSALGRWKVETGRGLVQDLLLEQEKSRMSELIPIRRQRMAASPFAFFRGTAVLQAHDLFLSPGTDFRVQACGDAHLANFGIFASPERRMVFDINDFDETLLAPFEVDVKRLAASIEICGRDRGFPKQLREEAVCGAAAAYQRAMMEFSDMGNMEVWYRHLDMGSFLEDTSHFSDRAQEKRVRDAVDRAGSKNSDLAVHKLTEIVDGKLRIKSDPPYIVPIRDMLTEEKALYDFHAGILRALALYKESLPMERRGLIEQYEPLELAHKVVGVGSVGRKAWILVLMGRENGDPLVLQIKEAEKSVLEDYYGLSPYPECGRRVVEGQRAIQTAGDILLGWVRLLRNDGRMSDYHVRQLWDAKGAFDLETISGEGLKGLSVLCAWTLAHAHAKTGDRHALAGYLGKSDAFENAMASYAFAYADQNEADYAMFLKMQK